MKMHVQRYLVGVQYRGTHLCGFVKSTHNPLPSVEGLLCGSLDGFLHVKGAAGAARVRSNTRTESGAEADSPDTEKEKKVKKEMMG